jgi:hypothetical protein
MAARTGLKTRPQFLKVLCILSYIGIGINILVALFGLLYSSMLDGPNDSSSSPLSFFAQSGFMSLKNLLIELTSLAGVFLMWRLKKVGFYIYLSAESFLYFEFIYLISSHNFGSAGTTQIGFEMLWPLPLDFGFFIMYATQLKYMPKKIGLIQADRVSIQ